MKKYNYQDQFEMVYLRHEYADRCVNLNQEYIEEFTGIIYTTARIMFYKHYPEFHRLGFELEDIVTVTSMYLMYYMELYSLRNNLKNRKKYIKKYLQKNNKKPTDNHISYYDRNSMINFLRQKLSHMSTICSRKARNVCVGVDKKFVFAATNDTTLVDNEVLLEDHKKYGYRKVTTKEFKEMKRRAKNNRDRFLTDGKGFHAVEVNIKNTGIHERDYSLLFNTNINSYCTDPEKFLINMEESKEFTRYHTIFDKLQNDIKIKKLSNFIRKNKNNKYLKEEILIARKMLEDLKQ